MAPYRPRTGQRAPWPSAHTANRDLALGTLEIMSKRMMLRSGELLTVALVLLLGCTACAAEPAQIDPGNRPTLAPEQTTGEACAASKAEVDSLISGMKHQVAQASKDVTAGKMPDLASIVAQLQASAEALTENVSNPEVLSALESVRTEVDRFAAITAPDTLLGMPGYLSSIGTQLGKLQDAGKQLTSLCKLD